MPTTKDHKKTKASSSYVLWPIIVLVLIASGFSIRSFCKNKEVIAYNTPVQVVPGKVQEPTVQEPTEATSEISGKYYGLCAKNSVHSVKDFRSTVEKDPTLSNHFEGFNWQTAHLGKQDNEVWTYVSYRNGEIIRRTSKPVKLPKGDEYITDGTRMVRTFCCNDYVAAPPPSSANPGPTERVDSPQRRIAGPSGPPTTIALQNEPPPPIDKSLETFPSTYKSSGSGGGSGGSSHNFSIYSGGTGSTNTTTPPTVVPEPSTLILLIAGITAVAFLRSHTSRLRARPTKGEGDVDH